MYQWDIPQIDESILTRKKIETYVLQVMDSW